MWSVNKGLSGNPQVTSLRVLGSFTYNIFWGKKSIKKWSGNRRVPGYSGMYHTLWTYFELRKLIKSCQLLEKSGSDWSYYYGFKKTFYKIITFNKEIHPLRVCLISIWTILRGFLVTGWFEIFFFDSCEKFMQIPLKVNKIHFLLHQAWPHNDQLILKTKVWNYIFARYTWCLFCRP